MVDQIPDELLQLDSKGYGEFVAAGEAIRQAVLTWPHQSGLMLEKVRGIRKINPVALIYRALSKCSDQHPPADVVGLGFITDKALRDDLRQNIATVFRALSNHEYKAATVIAGSVIEASPSRARAAGNGGAEKEGGKKDPPRLVYWTLHDYTTIPRPPNSRSRWDAICSDLSLSSRTSPRCSRQY